MVKYLTGTVKTEGFRKYIVHESYLLWWHIAYTAISLVVIVVYGPPSLEYGIQLKKDLLCRKMSLLPVLFTHTGSTITMCIIKLNKCGIARVIFIVSFFLILLFTCIIYNNCA